MIHSAQTNPTRAGRRARRRATTQNGFSFRPPPFSKNRKNDVRISSRSLEYTTSTYHHQRPLQNLKDQHKIHHFIMRVHHCSQLIVSAIAFVGGVCSTEEETSYGVGKNRVGYCSASALFSRLYLILNVRVSFKRLLPPIQT